MPSKSNAVAVQDFEGNQIYVFPDANGNIMVSDLSKGFNLRVIALLLKKHNKVDNRITPRKKGWFSAQKWKTFSKITAVFADLEPVNDSWNKPHPAATKEAVSVKPSVPTPKPLLIHGVGRTTVAHVFPDVNGNILVSDITKAFKMKVVELILKKGSANYRITPRKDEYFSAQKWMTFEKISAVLAGPQINSSLIPLPIAKNVTKKLAKPVQPIVQTSKPPTESSVKKPVSVSTSELNVSNRPIENLTKFPRFVEMQYENHRAKMIPVGEGGEIQCADINACFNREVKNLVFTQGDKSVTIAPRKAGYFMMPQLDMTRAMSVSYVFGITYYDLQVFINGTNNSVWAKPDDDGLLKLKEQAFGGKVIAIDIVTDDRQKLLHPPIEINDGISTFDKPNCGWKHCNRIDAVTYNSTPPPAVAHYPGSYEYFLEQYHTTDDAVTRVYPSNVRHVEPVEENEEAEVGWKELLVGGGLVAAVLTGLRHIF